MTKKKNFKKGARERGFLTPDGKATPETIATISGIACGLAAVLSCFERLDRPNDPYPVTQEERDLIVEIAQTHQAVLRELLIRDGFFLPILADGSISFTVQFNTDDDCLIGSKTDLYLTLPFDRFYDDPPAPFNP